MRYLAGFFFLVLALVPGMARPNVPSISGPPKAQQQQQQQQPLERVEHGYSAPPTQNYLPSADAPVVSYLPSPPSTYHAVQPPPLRTSQLSPNPFSNPSVGVNLGPSQPFGAPLSAIPFSTRVRPFAILRYENVAPSGNNQAWRYNYETENGISQQAEGQLVRVGNTQVMAMSGSYSYIGPNGVTYEVSWVADENGYRPTGAHIPQLPDLAFSVQTSSAGDAVASAPAPNFAEDDSLSVQALLQNPDTLPTYEL